MLAFPGAMGFGAQAKGGYGGKVIRVTSLGNSGSGTLRAALEASGPRIIVFEASGYIKLTSDIIIRNPYVTIAGQTAPTGGVTIRDFGLYLITHDFIMQHVRIRPGDLQSPKLTSTQASKLDTFGMNGERVYNVILDHCSFSWSIDETISMWGSNTAEGPHDITIQNCLIAEALRNSLHPKGAHSLIVLTPPNGRRISLLKNLIASATDRFPLITNGGEIYIGNNMLYNWDSGRATGVGNSNRGSVKVVHPTLVAAVNNFYVKGPNTTPSAYAIKTTSDLDAGAKLFHSGNKTEGIRGVFQNGASFNPLVDLPPIIAPDFTPMPVEGVESYMAVSVGARPADRDGTDRRILDYVRNRRGAIIDKTSQVGGFPYFASKTARLSIPTDPDDIQAYLAGAATAVER